MLVSELLGKPAPTTVLLHDPALAVWATLGLYLPVPETIRAAPDDFFAALRSWRAGGLSLRARQRLAQVYAHPQWRPWLTMKKLEMLEKQLLSIEGFEFFAPDETITLEMVAEFLSALCLGVGEDAYIPPTEEDTFYAWLDLCGRRPVVHAEILPGKVFSGDILGRVIAEDSHLSRLFFPRTKATSKFPPADLRKEFDRLVWDGRERKFAWHPGSPVNFNNTVVARTQESVDFPGACIFQTRNREWEVVHKDSGSLLHTGEPFSSREKAVLFLWLYFSLVGKDFLSRDSSYNKLESAKAYWLGDVLRAFIN